MNTTSSSFGSENEWTARLAGMLSIRSDVVVGIGDDAAVVRPSGSDVDVVYTTDAVAESVHFTPGTEPERIGRKIVGRLLSDLAAMGAEPDHILINLVVGPSHNAETLEALYAGAEERAAMFGACIIGGDTMKGESLALHGFATGHVPRGTAVLRSGAKIGDHVYITGSLGGSLQGKHLDFMPRVKEGAWLRENGWATAMMDISDGLAQDLERLCKRSGVGASLTAELIPVSDDATREQALSDGEDYELLFTVSEKNAVSFEQAWGAFSDLSCARVGQIVDAGEGITLHAADGTACTWPGERFDHLGD